MHLATDSVSGGSMSEAWLRTVTAVNLAPGRRYHHTVTRIARPAAERTEVRAAADWLSAELDYPTIDTVANTIFPQAVAETSDDHEELSDRYRAMYDTIRALDKANRKGTYFGRLVSYPTERGSHDQLAELIRKLNVEISLPGPKSARYEIGTDVPGGLTATRYHRSRRAATLYPSMQWSATGHQWDSHACRSARSSLTATRCT